jgi:hypothetical protein
MIEESDSDGTLAVNFGEKEGDRGGGAETNNYMNQN